MWGVSEHLQAHPEWGTLLASEDEAGLAESIVVWSQRKQRGECADAQAMADVAQGQFHTAAVGAAMVEVYQFRDRLEGGRCRSRNPAGPGGCRPSRIR